MLEPTLEARDAPMTSPTAKVFDNQSASSSALISIGGTVLAWAVLAGFMLWGGMGFLSAVFITLVVLVVFAVAAALFAAVLAPLLGVALVLLSIIGYLILALFAVVAGLFCAIFKLPFFRSSSK